jgi:DNA-damage-inducible protein D
MAEGEGALVVFQGKNIRRVWHNEDWYFSVVDVVEVLTESARPRKYWSDLKVKLSQEGFEPYDKIVPLKRMEYIPR